MTAPAGGASCYHSPGPESGPCDRACLLRSKSPIVGTAGPRYRDGATVCPIGRSGLQVPWASASAARRRIDFRRETSIVERPARDARLRMSGDIEINSKPCPGASAPDRWSRTLPSGLLRSAVLG